MFLFGYVLLVLLAALPLGRTILTTEAVRRSRSCTAFIATSATSRLPFSASYVSRQR